MDTKKVIITLFGLFFIFNAISCEKCPAYSCGSLESGACAFTNLTSSFVVQQCQSAQYCPHIDRNESCTVKPEPLYYPGSNCTLNSECTTGVCANNQCKGTAFKSTCATKDECTIGNTCLNDGTSTVCLAQLVAGAKCTSEFDCQNNLGCLNSICTPYFSLEDNTKSTDPNLCKSGFVSVDGVCKTFKNFDAIDAPCASDCVYQDLSKNMTNVTVADSCVCGFNKNDSKYCQLGSAHDYYKNYISAAVKLMNDTTNCHTAERKSPACANRLRSDKTMSFRKTVQSWGINFIMANHFPLLANSDSCVKYVAFSGYNDSPIRPDTFQCAKFTCEKSSKTCLHSINPFTDNGSNVTVALNRVCNNTQSCFAGPNGVADVYTEAEINGTCIDKTVITPTVSRYPGEACSKDTDCFSDGKTTGICANSTCAGLKELDDCTSTTQCNVGLYCNTSSKTAQCVKQVGNNANCTSTYDCLNNNFCFNSTCRVFGSLSTGSDISATTLGSFADDVNNKGLTCEFGTVSQKGNVCAQIQYASFEANNTNADGFVTCLFGNDCQYTDGTTPFKQTCSCGYNADGIGYCPIAQTTNADQWKNTVQTGVKKTNNKCHSYNRFNCYLQTNDLEAEEKLNSKKTVNAHLYYNSVECAYDVLSGSYIKYSVAAIALLLAFLF